MTYLDVISLASAKTYLRVDDTLTEDDATISRMINGAIAFIERATNVLFYDRQVTYLVDENYCVYVYDGPINSVVDPTSANDYDVENKDLYRIYTLKNNGTEIKLNVGHSSTDNIPPDLLQLAYELINLQYYPVNEKGIQANLTAYQKEVLTNNKRFVL